MNPQPKTRRIKCKKYLDWLKTQPCVKTGDYASEYISIVPCHQNIGYGHMGGKGHDIFALPLRSDLHAEEHRGHKTFWEYRDIPQTIIDHLTRYAIENDGFWNRKDFKLSLLDLVVREWK